MSPVEEKKKKRFIPSREEWKLAGIKWSLAAVFFVIIYFLFQKVRMMPLWIGLWLIITTSHTVSSIVNYIVKKFRSEKTKLDLD